MSFDASSLVGRMLGDYRVLSVIGEGGMGVVYEGHHPVIGKRVAIKVLRPDLTENREIAGRFLAEARAVNAIGHRGIVDVFAFGELPEGLTYLVMEYLEGQNFASVVASRAPVPVDEVLGWAHELLDALDAVHEAGIVHRDIKPSNVFLVEDKQGRRSVKLLDFGVAKGDALADAAPRTRESVLLGTPEYMAPEQVKGLPLTGQADLYALGAVLFELLTGRRLFPTENAMQVLWMHATQEPPRASTVNPAVPPLVDELLLWMLRKEPAQRPASAAALRARVATVRAHLLGGGRDGLGDSTGSRLPEPSPGSAQADASHDTVRDLAPVASRAAPTPGVAARGKATEGPPTTSLDARGPKAAGPRQRSGRDRRRLVVGGALFAITAIVLAVASRQGATSATSTGDAPASEAAGDALPPSKQEAVRPRTASRQGGEDPRRSGPRSTIELQARVDELEAKLKLREALRKEPDRVLRLLLTKARTSVIVAESAKDRLAAGKLLDELAEQLDGAPHEAAAPAPRAR